MENFVLYHEIYKREGLTMYKGRKKGTITYVAISCIDKGERLKVTNHVRLVFELEHKHIVKFYEWYETSNHLWLVTELCVGGTLAQLLEQDLRLPEDAVRIFGIHLVRGLCYMHCNELIYADWHPSKIILAGDGSLKFFDFSYSRKVNEDPQELIQRYFSTLNPEQKEIDDLFSNRPVCEYSSPEDLQGYPPDLVGDVWGLGCLLYQMFAGSAPFTGQNNEQLCHSILNTPLIIPKTHPTSLHFSDLLHKMLTKQPECRISLAELCAHSFWGGALDNVCGPSANVTRPHTATHIPQTMSDEDSSTATVNDDVSFTLHLGSRPCEPRDIVKEAPLSEEVLVTSPSLDRQQLLIMLATTNSKQITSLREDYSKMIKDGRLKYDVKLLPVTAYSLVKWRPLRKSDKDKHLRQIEGFLKVNDKGPPSQKRLHLINYLAQLCLVPEVSTYMVQCGLATDLCRQLKSTSNQEYVGRTCQALAVIFHHSHSAHDVQEALLMFADVVTVLTDILRDQFRCPRVKLPCVSALGEALIKLAELSTSAADCSVDCSAVSLAINLLNRCLHRTEEVMVSLAAARVFETMAQYAHSSLTKQLASPETLQQLYTAYKHATIDPLKSSTIKGLCGVSRVEPSLFIGLVDKVGLQGFMDNVHSSLLSVQEGILEMFLLSVISQSAGCHKLLQDSTLVTSVMRLLETTSCVVRGKALLLVLLLIEMDITLLKVATDQRLILYIEREIKRSSTEPDSVAARSVDLFTIFLAHNAVPSILRECCVSLSAVQGRKHPSSLHNKALRRSLPLLECVVVTVSSSSLRSAVLSGSASFCQSIDTLLSHVQHVDNNFTILGSDLSPNFVTHVMSLVETACHCQDSHLLVSTLLSTLLNITSTASNVDLRIIGLKLSGDIIHMVDSDGDSSLTYVETAVNSSFFPKIQQFFTDPDPSAVYVLRLLRHYVTLKPEGCIQACRSYAISSLFIQLMLDHQTRVMSATVLEGLMFLSAIATVCEDYLRDVVLEVDLINVLCELTLDIGDFYHKDDKDQQSAKTVEIFRSALSTLYILSRLVSDVVRLALQSKKKGEQPDIIAKLTTEAEELLGAGKPFTETVDLLILTVDSENADSDVGEMATKLLNQVVSLYGGQQIQHGLRDANIRSLCSAALSCSVTQRRTLLRILKRLLAASGNQPLNVGEGVTFMREMVSKLSAKCASDTDSVSEGLLEDISKYIEKI